jgi:hypothetical protein
MRSPYIDAIPKLCLNVVNPCQSYLPPSLGARHFLSLARLVVHSDAESGERGLPEWHSAKSQCSFHW